MKYRIRQPVKPSGRKIFFAEHKGLLFWESIGAAYWSDDPIAYKSREHAEAVICADIHERYAKTITLAEYEVK